MLAAPDLVPNRQPRVYLSHLSGLHLFLAIAIHPSHPTPLQFLTCLFLSPVSTGCQLFNFFLTNHHPPPSSSNFTLTSTSINPHQPPFPSPHLHPRTPQLDSNPQTPSLQVFQLITRQTLLLRSSLFYQGQTYFTNKTPPTSTQNSCLQLDLTILGSIPSPLIEPWSNGTAPLPYLPLPRSLWPPRQDPAA